MTGPAPSAATELDPPDAVLRWSAEEADRALDALEADVPSCRGAVSLDVPGAREAIVVGDTHGDWRSTAAAVQRFLEGPRERVLVGLGDYVDRAPADCRAGSVANAFYLLQLAARFPEQVFLLRGNHELHRAIPVMPHDLPKELGGLWGPDAEREARVASLLERGPLAATTPSGAYFAHAGFVRHADRNWKERLDRPDEPDLLELVWAECQESRAHRGVPRFTSVDLDEFAAATGAAIFLRGHDPDLNGRWALRNRCLTLQTTRSFQRFGGVLIARLDLTRAASAEAVRVEHLETEGQVYEASP